MLSGTVELTPPRLGPALRSFFIRAVMIEPMDPSELQSLADRIAAHRVKHDALAAEHEELSRQVDELLAQREAIQERDPR